ncbi:hypothetical protein FH972_023217 [Carpinus fangiana]|uniref:Uncharacterized protein n=1 Tax=Carpinus fangiana TaxID=176857 RepID=A0A5N6KUW5_9ROSI|nr:hypothetical protein FH972_023217 [Carpinus fangiana]
MPMLDTWDTRGLSPRSRRRKRVAGAKGSRCREQYPGTLGRSKKKWSRAKRLARRGSSVSVLKRSPKYGSELGALAATERHTHACFEKFRGSRAIQCASRIHSGHCPCPWRNAGSSQQWLGAEGTKGGCWPLLLCWLALRCVVGASTCCSVRGRHAAALRAPNSPSSGANPHPWLALQTFPEPLDRWRPPVALRATLANAVHVRDTTDHITTTTNRCPYCARRHSRPCLGSATNAKSETAYCFLSASRAPRQAPPHAVRVAWHNFPARQGTGHHRPPSAAPRTHNLRTHPRPTPTSIADRAPPPPLPDTVAAAHEPLVR